MSYLQSTLLIKKTTSTVSIVSNGSKSLKVQSILSRVQRFSSSYSLHPFSVIPISPDDQKFFDRAILKPGLAKSLSHPAFLLVLATRSEFKQDSFDGYINETGTNSRLSRKHLSTYLENIKKDINGTDTDGNRWANKQADIALQIITSSAKDYSLDAVVLKDIPVPAFDAQLALKEKGLKTYAVVAIG